MPNFSYIVGNSFTPFTMAEMLKPLETYSDAYNNLEDLYVALQDKANLFKYLSTALPEGSKARLLYEGYAKNLNESAESMLLHGLTMSNRRDLVNLKGRYSSEIGAIEKGLAALKALVEEQRKALAQDPTMLFSRRADLTSLDDFMANPNMSYTPYSGNYITKATAAAMQQVANGMLDYNATGRLDDYNKMLIQRTGFTPQLVLNAILNPQDPNNSPVFNAIIENVIDSTPIKSWGDDNVTQQAYNYARQGLYAGIGQVKSQIFEDKAATAALSLKNQKDLLDYKQQQAQALAKVLADAQNDNLRSNYRGVHTPKERTERDEYIKDYDKYFYRDENGWHLNKAGRDLLASEMKGTTIRSSLSTTGATYDMTVPGQFYTFLKDVVGVDDKALNNYKNTYTLHPNTIANHYSKYRQGYDPHDVTSSIEYIQSIDPTEYNKVLSVMNGIARNGKFSNYDYKKDEKTGAYSLARNDDYVYVGSLSSSNIKSANTVVGLHGNYLEVNVDWNKEGEDDDDKHKTIRIPISSYSNFYNNYINSSISKINNAVDKRKKNIKVIQLPDGSYKNINTFIINELNNMSDNALKSIGTSEVETKKVNNNPLESYYNFYDWSPTE